MSPKLKPLLLPQLVEERRKLQADVDAQQPYQQMYHYNWDHQQQHPYSAAIQSAQQLEAIGNEMSAAYHTMNSSASDITSPVTPTFSARGHVRYSSSTSSLELPPQIPDPCTPSSPTALLQSASVKNGPRPLPDVQEEPVEREDDAILNANRFSLYSCLCDTPCEHRSNSSASFSGTLMSDEVEYDFGFLSDSDFNAGAKFSKKRGSAVDSSLYSLTSRFGSRIGSLNRWKTNRRTNLASSPTTEVSLEHAMFPGPSSRSSSMSASYQFPYEVSVPPTPAMSHRSSIDSLQTPIADEGFNARCSIERDRSLATTPLLPPLMVSPFVKPPPASPLQSPTMAPRQLPRAMPEACKSPVMEPSNLPRPSLSTKASLASLRSGNKTSELPLPLPAILQEHDSWSDRLGHANFTISPMPYVPEVVNPETVSKFRDDWNTARVNFTKHLVRTGENYGQTGKIFKMTNNKWDEIESQWNEVYNKVRQENEPTSERQSRARASTVTSRSRSRGQNRSRSGSACAGLIRPANDEEFAEMQWRDVGRDFSSVVPQMLEALDVEGKFPRRGDEDIVGPMERDVAMVRSRSDEGKGARFWKHLVTKVGIRT